MWAWMNEVMRATDATTVAAGASRTHAFGEPVWSFAPTWISNGAPVRYATHADLRLIRAVYPPIVIPSLSGTATKRDDHCTNLTNRERGAVLSGSSLKNSENKAVANAIAAEITNTL